MGEPQDKRPYFPAGFITGADSKRRGAYHSNGNTVVLAGDKIVLSALSPEENLGICLTEIPIEKDSKWIGKPLSRIKLGEEKLVLVLKRNEKVVIPNGNTVIRENDVLVISQL